jgi:FixJ family two-component response regulator
MMNIVATVYLVDDDELVVRGLKRLLASEGYLVVAFSAGEEFLRHHDPDVPGCAIIDLGLPGMDGFGIQSSLASGMVGRPLIFLTGRGDIASGVKAIKAGATDFLTKPVDASVLLEAIARAMEQDNHAREDAYRRQSLEQRFSQLTAREREVLTGVVAGRLNKQIAAHLGTVEKTIKVHRGRLMRKLGVRTIADLVRLVVQRQS